MNQALMPALLDVISETFVALDRLCDMELLHAAKHRDLAMIGSIAPRSMIPECSFVTTNS